jgi:hypothetical protein
MRFAFDMRLTVAKRMLATKKAQGTAFTETAVISFIISGSPDSFENAYRTSIPADTISMGMNIAHMKPIIDCLYLSTMSRRVSIYNRSRYFLISLKTSNMFQFDMANMTYLEKILPHIRL